MSSLSLREVKLCLLGDAGVGKSSLVLRFVADSFNENSESTIGASFMSKTLIVEDQTFKYQIWDTAGQEKYRGLAPMYYRNAAAAIIVYEITRKQSFEALKHWVKELRQFGPSNIILAIAGNKSDLESQRQVSSDEAKEYADSIDALFVETSALTADNVSYLFEALSKRLPQESIAQPKPASTVQLVDETPNKPKNEKCGAC